MRKGGATATVVPTWVVTKPLVLIALKTSERLYDTYRTSRAFPDYAATLTNLGLRMNFGRIRTDDGAALADVRRAIMRPHPRLTVGPSAAPICDETPR